MKFDSKTCPNCMGASKSSRKGAALRGAISLMRATNLAPRAKWNCGLVGYLNNMQGAVIHELT